MVKRFNEEPADLAALADFAPDRAHADWRNDVLSFLLYSADPQASRSVVTPLRPAV